MNETIELDTITDLKELKSLKSDQYDALVSANDTVARCNQNIVLINQRIEVLQEMQATKDIVSHASASKKDYKPED